MSTEGVIFEIADRDRKPLEDSEGGYNAVMIDVVTANGPLSARTYVAWPDRVNDALRPYTWYKEYVVRGAQQHSLPQSYIERLETVESVEDPVKERRKRHEALLAELG